MFYMFLLGCVCVFLSQECVGGGGEEQKGAALVTLQKKQGGTVWSLGISHAFIRVFSGVFSPSLARTSH